MITAAPPTAHYPWFPSQGIYQPSVMESQYVGCNYLRGQLSPYPFGSDYPMQAQIKDRNGKMVKVSFMPWPGAIYDSALKDDNNPVLLRNSYWYQLDNPPALQGHC
ncbi:MAG: hypothetical protein ABI182_06620 [Candidatus Baltobacteraceae bacterium]